MLRHHARPQSPLLHQRWTSEPIPWHLGFSQGHVEGQGPDQVNDPKSFSNLALPSDPNRQFQLSSAFLVTGKPRSRPEVVSTYDGRPKVFQDRDGTRFVERQAPVHPTYTLPGRRNQVSEPDIVEDIRRPRPDNFDRSRNPSCIEGSFNTKSVSSGGVSVSDYGSQLINTQHRYVKRTIDNQNGSRSNSAFRELQNGSRTNCERAGRVSEEGGDAGCRRGTAFGAKNATARRKEKENRLNLSLLQKPDLRDFGWATADMSGYSVNCGRLSKSFGDIRVGPYSRDVVENPELSPVYENGCMATILRKEPLSLGRLTSELLGLACREARTPKADTSVMNWDTLQKTLKIGCKNRRPQNYPELPGPPKRPLDRMERQCQPCCGVDCPTNQEQQKRPCSRSNLFFPGTSRSHSKARRRLFEHSSDDLTGPEVEDIVSPLCGMNQACDIEGTGSPESVGVNVDWDDEMTTRKSFLPARTTIGVETHTSLPSATGRLCLNSDCIYESIADFDARRLSHSTIGPHRHECLDPLSPLDNTYDTIGDFSFPGTRSISPPPLPPPPLPVRTRSTRMRQGEASSNIPAERTFQPRSSSQRQIPGTNIVDLSAEHIYTITDVLESLERLAAHLPKAKESIEGLCQAGFLKRPEAEAQRGSAFTSGGKTFTEVGQDRKHDLEAREKINENSNIRCEVGYVSSRETGPFLGSEVAEVEMDEVKEVMNSAAESYDASFTRCKKDHCVSTIIREDGRTRNSTTLTKKTSERKSKFRKLVPKTTESEIPVSTHHETIRQRNLEAEPGCLNSRTVRGHAEATSGGHIDWYQKFPLKKLWDRIQPRDRRQRKNQSENHSDAIEFDSGTIPKNPGKRETSKKTKRASSADRLNVVDRTGDKSRRATTVLCSNPEPNITYTNSNSLKPDLKTNRTEIGGRMDLLPSALTSDPRLQWMKMSATQEIFC